MIKRQEKVTWSVYSQEYSLNIHSVLLNKPSSKAETARVGEVDHGLAEGEGETVHVGISLGVPAQ